MDFAHTPRVEQLRGELTDFMDTHVYPAEPIYRQQMHDSGDPHHHPPILEDLKKEARSWGWIVGARVRPSGRDHRAKRPTRT
jgi:acyl-CoA dehydrogenase